MFCNCRYLFIREDELKEIKTKNTKSNIIKFAYWFTGISLFTGFIILGYFGLRKYNWDKISWPRLPSAPKPKT